MKNIGQSLNIIMKASIFPNEDAVIEKKINAYGRNHFSKKKAANKSSKYKGVSWYKGIKRYRACIFLNRKRICLGYFKNEIDAARAYNAKARVLFGDFAKLNDV